MIRTIRHKGLKRLFEQDDPSGVNPEHADKLGIFWQRFMQPLPLRTWIYRLWLHPLKGKLEGFWAVRFRANWRVILRFDAGAEDVDYVDYH
jgi:toxin HigB-1